MRNSADVRNCENGSIKQLQLPLNNFELCGADSILLIVAGHLTLLAFSNFRKKKTRANLEKLAPYGVNRMLLWTWLMSLGIYCRRCHSSWATRQCKMNWKQKISIFCIKKPFLATGKKKRSKKHPRLTQCFNISCFLIAYIEVAPYIATARRFAAQPLADKLNKIF